jgi:hypothetical protein
MRRNGASCGTRRKETRSYGIVWQFVARAKMMQQMMRNLQRRR